MNIKEYEATGSRKPLWLEETAKMGASYRVERPKKCLRYNPGMTLSRKEVEHIALLAHLHLTEEELDRYRGQLESILDYASRLSRVDTSSISPTTTVLPIHSVLREDSIRESLDREEALRNAPQRDRDMFRIPPVFE